MKLPVGKLKEKKGQAAIEFIVCIVVIFFFLLFYLSMSLLLVVSDYIDYATFMAARTYRSAYNSEDTQEQNAQQVFDAYSSKVQGIARNFSPLKFTETEPGSQQTGGVTVTYDIDMFYLPPLFVTKGAAPVSRITLDAESHLGREPGVNECQEYFNQFGAKAGAGDISGIIDAMDDNGC